MFLPASQKTLRKNTDNPFQKSHLCRFCPHLKKRSEKLLTIHFKALIFVVFACISKKAQKNYWQSISKVSSLSFLPASQKTLRKITDNPFQRSHLSCFCPHLKKRSEKILTIHFKSLIFVVFARISKNAQKNYWQSISKVSFLSVLLASQKRLRKITDNPFRKSHLCRFCPHLKKRSEKLLTIHFKGLNLKKRSEKLLIINFKSLIFVVFARISKNAQKNYWQSISKVSFCRFCPHLKKRSEKFDNPFQRSHLCRFCPHLKKQWEKLLTIQFKGLIFVVFARISKNAQKKYWQSFSEVSSLWFSPASQKTLRKTTDNPFQRSHFCRFCMHLKKGSEKLLTIHFESLIFVVFARISKNSQKNYWQSISKVSSLSFLPASQKTLRKITDNPFQKSHLCRFCPHLKKQWEKLPTIQFKRLIFVVFARISKNAEKNYWQSISKVSSLWFLPASQKTLRKTTDNPFQKSHFVVFARISKNAQKNYWQSISKVLSLSFLSASQKTLRKITDNPFQRSHLCRFRPHLKKQWEKLLTIQFKGLIFVVFARISKNAQKNYWQSISKVSSLSFLPASQKTLRKITDNPFQKSHLCRFCPHLKKQWEKLPTIHFKRLIFVVFARISKNAEKKYWQSISKVSSLWFLPASQKTLRKTTDNPFQKSHFVVFARISKNAQKNYWQSISKVLSLSFLSASQKTLRKITDNPFQRSHLCRFRPHLKKQWEKLLTIQFKGLIFVVFARISKNAQKKYWQSISKVSSVSFLPASQKTLRKNTDNPFQKSQFVVFARISKNAQKNYWQSISKVSSLSFLPASQKAMRKITDNPFQRSHLCRFCPHLKKRSEKLLTIHFKSLIFVVFARISKNAQTNYWQSISKVSSLSFLPASQKTLRKITDNPFRSSYLCHFCPHLKKQWEKLLTIHFKRLIFVVFARISKNAEKNYWQSISKVTFLSFLPASQKTLRKVTDNRFQRSHLCRFCPHLKKRSEKLLTIHFKSLILSFLPASQKTLREITDNPFRRSHLCRFCPHLKKQWEKLLTIHSKGLIFVVFARISKNAQTNYWQSISKVSSLSFLPASQKTLRQTTDNPFQKSHLCHFCPHLKKRSEKLLTIHFEVLISVIFARISKNNEKNYWQSISNVSSLSFLPASQKTLRKIADNPFQKSHFCRFCAHLKKRSEKLLTIDFKSLIFLVFARISKNAQKNYWQSISKVSFCRFCPHLKKRSEKILTIHFEGLTFVVFARISKNNEKNYWQSIPKVSSLWFSPASQKTPRKITDNPFQKSHLCGFCPQFKKRSEKLLTIHFKSLISSFLPASQKTLRKITDNPFQRSHLCRFCPHLKKRSEKLLTIHFKGLIFVVFARISKNAQKNYWQSISKVSSLSFLPASEKTLRKITDNPFQKSHLCRFCPHLKKRSEKTLTIHFKSLIFVVFGRISKKRSEKLLTIHFKSLIFVVFARISKNAQKKYWQSISKVSFRRFCPHLKKRSEKLLTIHFKSLIFVVFARISKNAQKKYWQSISKVSFRRFCPHLKKRSEKLLTIHFKSLIFVVFARISKNAQTNYWQSISKVSSLSFLTASQKTLKKVTDNPFQRSHLYRFCPHLKKRSEELLTIHFKSFISSFLPASQKTLRKVTDNPFQMSHLCRFCPHLKKRSEELLTIPFKSLIFVVFGRISKKRSEKLLTIHFKSLIFVVFARISKNAQKKYWQSISKVSFRRFCPHLKKRSEKLLTIHFKSLIFVVFARISKNAQTNYWQSISKVSSLSFLTASQKTLKKVTDNPFQRSHLYRFCPHLKKRSEELLTIHFKSFISSFLPASQKTLRKVTDNPFQMSHLCRFCPHLKKRSEELLTIHFKSLIFVVFARISKNAQKNYWQSISKVSALSFLPASQKTLEKITDNPFQKSHLCRFWPHLKKRSEKLLTIHFKSLIFVVFARISKNAQKNYWQSISKISSLLFLPASQKTLRKITDNPFQKSHFVVFARISKNAQKSFWQSISKVSSLWFLPASQKTLRQTTDNPFQKSHLCYFCPHLNERSEKLLTIHFKGLIFVVFARISKNAQKNYWKSISKVSFRRFCPHLKKRSEKLLTIHFKGLIFVVFARISKNAQKNYWQSISKVSSLSFSPASEKTMRKITDNPFQMSHLCRFCPHLKKRSEKLLTIDFKRLIFVVFARISKNAQKNYWQSISKVSFSRFCPHLKKPSGKLLTIHFKGLTFVVFARISKNAQKNYWQSISKVSSLSFLPASQKTLRKITDNPFQRPHLCRFCPHLKKRSEKLLTIHFKSLIFVVFARISKNAQTNYWQSILKVSSLSFLPASQKRLRKITDNPFQRSHLCRFCPHLKKRSEKLLTIHFKGLIFVVFARISKNAQKIYWQSISKVSFRRFCPHLKKRSEKLLTIHFKGLIFVVFARISKNAQKNYWQYISKVSSLSFSPASEKTMRKITDNPFQRSHLCRFCPHLKKRSEKLLTIDFKRLIFVVFARISKNAQKNYWQSISKVSFSRFCPHLKKPSGKILTIHFKGLIFVVFARISKNAQKNYWQSNSKVSSLSFLPASRKTLRKNTDNPFQKSHLCGFRPHLKKRSEKLLTIHFKGLIFVVFACISKKAQKNYWQSISKVSSLSFLPASQKTLRKITDNPFQKSHLCRFCPHLKKRSEKLLTIHFKSFIVVVFARISKNNEKNYWQSISKASSLSFLPSSEKTLRKVTDNPFQKSHLCGFCPHLKKRSDKLLTIHFKSLIFVIFARISKNAQKNYWQSISKVSSLSSLPASQKTLRKITDNPFRRSHPCNFLPAYQKQWEKLLTIHFKRLIFVVFARISKNAEEKHWQSISKVSSLWFLPASQKTLRKNTDNTFQRSHLCRFCPHLKKRSEKLMTIHFKSLIFVVFARNWRNNEKNYWQSISKVSSLSFLPVSQKTLRKITDNQFQKSHLCRFCPHLKKRSEKLLTIHFKGLILVVFARISKNAKKKYWQSISKVSSLSFLPASQKTLRKITDNPFQSSHFCRFCMHLKKSSEELLTIHFESLIFVVFARISKNAQKNYWQSISKVSS